MARSARGQRFARNLSRFVARLNHRLYRPIKLSRKPCRSRGRKDRSQIYPEICAAIRECLVGALEVGIKYGIIVINL
jgi:hypothetical protein